VPACGPTIHPSFDSPEPAARNAAIVRAADQGDRSAIPDLVRMLDSDDPATRLLAIRTLERLEGTTLGYDHAASIPDRDQAIARWVQRVQPNAKAPPP
jgi:HEAT repeat protein